MATEPPQTPRRRPAYSFWQSPLAPVASAFTIGIVLDRWQSLPLATSLAAACTLTFACVACQRRNLEPTAAPLLWLAMLACGSAYHQWYRETVADNDVR